MRAWFSGWLAVGLLGCSAAHVEEPEPISIEALCRDISTDICRGRDTCCPNPDPRVTETDCNAILTRQCNTAISLQQQHWEGLTWPDLRVDARRAAKLTAQFQAAADECLAPPPLEAVQALLTPYKRAGDPCAFDHECSDSHVCRPTGTDDARRCSPIGATGDRCVSNEQCEASLWCVTDAMTGTATCQIGAKIGEACDRQECLSGLACRSTLEEGSSGWICEAPPETGASCEGGPWTLTPQCGDLAHCTYVGVFACQPSAAVGEECVEDADCVSRLCARQPQARGACIACNATDCGPMGTCDGDVCRTMNEHGNPRWPTVASVADTNDGEPCLEARQCFSGRCDDGRCARRNGEDAYCYLIVAAP